MIKHRCTSITQVRSRLFISALFVFLLGCDAVNGVDCVLHSDCGHGICTNGICIEGTDDANIDTADSDTESSLQPPSLAANLDVLFVVDNSGSMSQEQELLATSMYSFFNALHEGVKEGFWIDTRMAVISSDMGVSYKGGVYEDRDWTFANEQVKCDDSGDNGRMMDEYYDNQVEVTLPVTPSKITCREDANNCPDGWDCMNMNLQGVGTCTPKFAQQLVTCPEIEDYTKGKPFISPQVEGENGSEMNYPGFIAAGACLMHTGTQGCNYEQPLAAIPAALTKDSQQFFLRSDALTLIFLITDEEDCSIENPEWFELDELRNVTANLACGRHTGLLQNVADIHSQILAAKEAATGVDGFHSVLFAAITGVPIGPGCEGRGDKIADCMDMKPDVNGSGTMAAPEEISRTLASGVEQYYFEYACRRYADGADPKEDAPITAAYPATRIVKLAQQFGQNGFVYSICNEDWTPLMTQLGQVVQQRLDIEY